MWSKWRSETAKWHLMSIPLFSFKQGLIIICYFHSKTIYRTKSKSDFREHSGTASAGVVWGLLSVDQYRASAHDLLGLVAILSLAAPAVPCSPSWREVRMADCWHDTGRWITFIMIIVMDVVDAGGCPWHLLFGCNDISHVIFCQSHSHCRPSTDCRRLRRGWMEPGANIKVVGMGNLEKCPARSIWNLLCGWDAWGIFR